MAKKRTPKPPQTRDLNRSIIGLDDLARRPGTRIRRPVLIVCEGKKTEQIYLNALRSHYRLATVEVEIHGEGAGPLAVVEQAIELAERRRRNRKHGPTAMPAFAEIWCVFDREANNEPRDFRQAIRLAETHRIRLAVSNPAFEYWYLLHFIETDRAFQHADDVLVELRRPGRLVGYEKHHNVFAILREHTTNAYERAERLYDRCSARDDDQFPNPSTLVHQLIGGIIAMTPYYR